MVMDIKDRFSEESLRTIKEYLIENIVLSYRKTIKKQFDVKN